MAEVLKRQVHNIGRRRAWLIWAVGMSVYILAVFHRTSFGVAGLLAAERFHINASQLSTFTVLQLLVYAAMQVPVGVLLDRFGSKRLMLTGLVFMSVGQLAFAFVETFLGGVAARVLLGLGDSMVFISLMRIIALWFKVKQVPLVTQFTGMLGQVGAIIAATPLTAALTAFGWTKTFAGAASLGVIVGILLVVIVKDSPYQGEAIEAIKLRAMAIAVRDIWISPGNRLGVYIHFTTMFSAAMFGLLWGFPFLVAGQGLSDIAAGWLLIIMTFTAMVVGPIMGKVTARYPIARSRIVLVNIGVIALVWAIVLARSERSPLWLLIVLVFVTASGGPASMVSFDLARTFNPPTRIGRATGIVNMGGFISTLLSMGVIGVVLDVLEPAGPTAYTLDDFRIAMASQFVFWAFGMIQIYRYRHKAIAHLERTYPGSMQAIRGGDPLVSGLSKDLDPPE